jgi:hypothetical protein
LRTATCCEPDYGFDLERDLVRKLKNKKALDFSKGLSGIACPVFTGDGTPSDSGAEPTCCATDYGFDLERDLIGKYKKQKSLRFL